MNDLIFISICRQIIEDMAYLPGLQANTFAVMRGAPDFGSDSLGYDYQDYLEGKFWSRSWVNQQAPPDGIKAEYPMFFIENISAIMECLGEDELEYEWNFLIIDKIPCEDCPPNQTRTAESVKRNVLMMLRSFLEELNSYGLWEIEYPENPDIRYEWTSQGRIEYYEQNFDELQIQPLELKQELMVLVDPNKPIEMREWGPADFVKEHRAFFTTIRIRMCEPIETTFKYNQQINKNLSLPICPTC